MEALVKMHRAKHAKLEEENNELRGQAEFLQGVIRERKKETKKTTASESSPDAASKVESATKPKTGGTSSGCSVTMSVTRIVSRFKYYVLKISLISFLFTKGQPMTHFFAYVLCSNQGDSSLNREFADLNSNHFKKFLSSV